MKAIALMIGFFVALNGANYVVPAEYDNLKNSAKSTGYTIIRQDTPSLSASNYTIGGVSSKYRCVTVPKITCRATANISMNATISEVNLKHPASNESVNNFGQDLRVEEDSANFYLCGAAYGGMTYDELTISVSGTDLNYEYKGNNQAQVYRFFTDANHETVPNSYMSITYQQICR